MRMYIIVLVVALLLGGCTESEKDKLRNQVSELKSQLHQLQRKNEKLKKDYHELREEYEIAKKVHNLPNNPLRPKRGRSSGIYDKVFQ